MKTEQEMRDATVPWLETPEELSNYIRDLVEINHDYGTCAHAMSMAATAAFNYVAKQLGTTGFQAGYAAMDVLRRVNGIDCPFIVIKAEDDLYPQYNNIAKVIEAQEQWKKWVTDKAIEKLENHKDSAATQVVEHWQKLAARGSASVEVEDA